jgi:hypothetical protein
MKLRNVIMITLFLIILFLSISILSSQDSRDIIPLPDGEEEYRTERLAIIVGINDYDNITDLEYAVKDANLIGKTLQSYGNFTLEKYTDNSPKAPSKYNIMKALEAVSEDAEYGLVNTFVFYFAGHGFQREGVNYLAPGEINPEEISNTGININEVLKIIDNIKDNAKAMVFLDACRNDPLSGKRGGNGTWIDNDSRGLGVLYST